MAWITVAAIIVAADLADTPRLRQAAGVDPHSHGQFTSRRSNKFAAAMFHT
jgi:hypothetical protein